MKTENAIKKLKKLGWDVSESISRGTDASTFDCKKNNETIWFCSQSGISWNFCLSSEKYSNTIYGMKLKQALSYAQ